MATALTDMLSNCTLCPRACGVDRLAGETGFCGAGTSTKIFRFAPHYGEEPPVSGPRGSGTVFFSHCTLECMYCQNHPWSQDYGGVEYDIDGLVAIFRGLADDGCHNWNLVSPTPWLPMITEALEKTKQCGISLPIVYNTSSFETVSTLSALDGMVDVYLADLRYAEGSTAAEASGAPGYVAIARDAMREMWQQVGALSVDSDGIAGKGVICRILILPGHAEEAVANLRWLGESFGTGIAVSVMSQYMPLHRAKGNGTWGRTIEGREYDMVCKEADRIGFEYGWMQDFEESSPEGLVGENMEPNS